MSPLPSPLKSPVAITVQVGGMFPMLADEATCVPSRHRWLLRARHDRPSSRAPQPRDDRRMRDNLPRDRGCTRDFASRLAMPLNAAFSSRRFSRRFMSPSIFRLLQQNWPKSEHVCPLFGPQRRDGAAVCWERTRLSRLTMTTSAARSRNLNVEGATMRQRIFPLASILLLFAFPARSADLIAHVGVENWIFGHGNQFPFALGSGGDVKLKRVWGAMGHGRSPATPPPLNNWQSLVSLLAPSMAWGPPIKGQTGSKPNSGKGVNFSIDNSLGAWNLKQMGNEVVHIPVNITFAEPVAVPGGQLVIVVDTETAGSTAAAEALDTEVQLTFEFEPASPAAAPVPPSATPPRPVPR
jgi:hypothetical protein